PTRTYLPVLKKLLAELKGEIHGLIHNTGGGQTKVLHFVENKTIIKDNLLPLPPLFQLIHEESGTDWKEMYQVFNMGCRLEVYLPEKHAQQVVDIARSFHIDAQVVGRVEEGKGKGLRIKSKHGEFVY
ncbi:MAG: phosphoribosylformylglycinamidine cyclo-ligase, partial [Phaeodactylibacter sp.]|nr:phosphoribosylformylglycinamidine cyclo-ligase [Phaeodactylibacter sp.]